MKKKNEKFSGPFLKAKISIFASLFYILLRKKNRVGWVPLSSFDFLKMVWMVTGGGGWCGINTPK